MSYTIFQWWPYLLYSVHRYCTMYTVVNQSIYRFKTNCLNNYWNIIRKFCMLMWIYHNYVDSYGNFSFYRTIGRIAWIRINPQSTILNILSIAPLWEFFKNLKIPNPFRGIQSRSKGEIRHRCEGCKRLSANLIVAILKRFL